MQYKAISADGHVNEPPTLWVENLPAKFRERGPRVIETRTAIASCPWAYLRLAQGFVVNNRHDELLRRGGRVALGCDAENAGVMLMLNPPYPYSSVGVFPSLTSPFLCTRNMLICVPSFDGYHTCSTSTVVGSTGTGGRSHNSGSTDGFVKSTRKIVVG